MAAGIAIGAVSLSKLDDRTIKPVLGATTGKRILNILPQKLFDILVLTLACAGATWLILG